MSLKVVLKSNKRLKIKRKLLRFGKQQGRKSIKRRSQIQSNINLKIKILLTISMISKFKNKKIIEKALKMANKVIKVQLSKNN